MQRLLILTNDPRVYKLWYCYIHCCYFKQKSLLKLMLMVWQQVNLPLLRGNVTYRCCCCTAVVGSFLKWERHHELNIYSIQDNIIKQYSLKTHELKMFLVLCMYMHLFSNLPLHEVDCWNIFDTLDTSLAKIGIYRSFDLFIK